MIDCWHTQLRLVAQYFPNHQIRPLRTTQDRIGKTGVFAWVSPSVDRREIRCPVNVVQTFKEAGYTIIHVQEPRE